MADVFVSYAREDTEVVRELVRVLELRGFSVFWDRDLAIGAEFETRLEQALAETLCIIVVWSANSVASPWVRGEAHEGLERGILIPVRLDDTKLPLAFRGLETAHLGKWPERARHVELRKVIGGIRSLVGQPNQPIDGYAPIRDDPTISSRVAERVVRALEEDRVGQHQVESILADAAFALLRGAPQADVSREFINQLAQTLCCSVAVVRSQSGHTLRVVDRHARTDEATLDRLLTLTAGDGVRLILSTDEDLVVQSAAWCLRVDATRGVRVAFVCTDGAKPPSPSVVKRLAYATQFVTVLD